MIYRTVYHTTRRPVDWPTRARRRPQETLAAGIARIRTTARMRYGMVAGLIIAALAQTMPITAGEPFAALLRDLAPALLIACIAIPAVAYVARRDERRLREHPEVLRLR